MSDVTFKELIEPMSEVVGALGAAMVAGGHQGEGLKQVATRYGYEQSVPQQCLSAGSSPDFLLGLFVGTQLGNQRAQADIPTDEAAAQADAELEAAARDEALAEIEPEIVGNQP